MILILLFRPNKINFPDIDSVFRTIEHVKGNENSDLYPRDWFIADHKFVLPEYIIKFKYLSSVSNILKMSFAVLYW